MHKFECMHTVYTARKFSRSNIFEVQQCSMKTTKKFYPQKFSVAISCMCNLACQSSKQLYPPNLYYMIVHPLCKFLLKHSGRSRSMLYINLTVVRACMHTSCQIVQPRHPNSSLSPAVTMALDSSALYNFVLYRPFTVAYFNINFG